MAGSVDKAGDSGDGTGRYIDPNIRSPGEKYLRPTNGAEHAFSFCGGGVVGLAAVD
jgi:hypothetical protein